MKYSPVKFAFKALKCLLI